MYGRQRESSGARCTASRWTRRIWRYTCILALLLQVHVLADDFVASPEPLINTKWGLVRGKFSRSVRDRPIANFLGIPYALPPVGDLRFQSPQRWNRTWTAVRDVTVDGQQCMQIDMKTSHVVGSEDCLYLNVFVPYISDKQQESVKLPVLVYVHGGAFVLGSSRLFTPDYLLDQNVILVTLNYRLNIMGFFSTTNRVAPGNYGIKDVKMALEWIQENIRDFKGNPESVTVMGASAGASITHFLSLSNKTEGLFHRYILHSGSALNEYALYPRKTYRKVCRELVRLVNCLPPKRSDDAVSATTESPEETNGDAPCEDCDTEDEEEMMKCMRSVDARKLVQVTNYLHVWRQHPIVIMAPTLEDNAEDAIVTMHPKKILRNGLFRDIPAIIQVTQDEGLVETLDFFVDPNIEKEMIVNYEEYLPILSERQLAFNASLVAAETQDFYFNGDVALGVKNNITNLITDVICWPIFRALRYQSEVQNSSLYFSLFAYQGTFTESFASGYPIHYGVAHGDDLNYIFPVLNNQYWDMMLHNTENDFTMINIMTEMWTSFVIDGIPKAWRIPAWPNYRDHHQFMRFGIGGSPDIVVQTDFLLDRMEFWDKLMANATDDEIEGDVFIGDPPEEMLNGDARHCIFDYKLTVIYLILLIIGFLYI